MWQSLALNRLRHQETGALWPRLEHVLEDAAHVPSPHIQCAINTRSTAQELRQLGLEK